MRGLRGRGIPDIPQRYMEYVKTHRVWQHTRKCGLNGVTRGCPTLYQQGCILKGPCGDFSVVLAFSIQLAHMKQNATRDFRHFVTTSPCNQTIIQTLQNINGSTMKRKLKVETIHEASYSLPKSYNMLYAVNCE